MITVESFGATCPKNWEEIAEYLNRRILDGEDTEEIWEAYCNGYIPEAPEADFLE